MIRGSPRRTARLVLAAFVLLLCAPLVGTAAAAEDDAPAVAQDAAAAGATDIAAFEDRLLRHPVARIALLVARFLPMAVGIGLLIAAYLRWDRIRGGALPPPAPTSVSTPLALVPGVLLATGAMMIVPAVVLIVVTAVQGAGLEGASLGAQMGASAAGSVPLAVLILLRRRRRRLVAGDAAVAEVFGDAAMPHRWEPRLLGAPTPPPTMARAAGLGLWTFCVAAVIVTPVALAWAFVLEGLGVGAQAQELVVKVVDSKTGYEPWLILVFGVCVAPLVEECIFRGMLYPAAKRALGGTPRAAWLAALGVSGVFAAIHMNWLALLPLFALAMVLTWIFERTNSLAACVFAHAIHNGLSLLPLLLLRYA